MIMYALYCKKCDELGATFCIDEIWGLFEVPIIDFFKFMTYHIKNCGEKNIKIINWDASEWGEDKKCVTYLLNTKEYKEFLRKTEGLFPESRDWFFAKEVLDQVGSEEYECEKYHRLEQAWLKKQGRIVNKLTKEED